MGVILSNNATGKLSAAITASATSIYLQSGNGAAFPLPTADEWFPMTLIKATGELEIVKCTYRSADTFTVVRAQEGTVGLSFNAGDRVSCRFTALAYAEKQNRITLLDGLTKDATAKQFRDAVGAADAALDSFMKGRVGTGGGLSFRNKIVDGQFDFWHEGDSVSSVSANTYGAATMWRNGSLLDTSIQSKQPLVTGVDLPSIEVPTAKYFMRTTANSVTGGYSVSQHKIEGVNTLAGKDVTLSFYAKANSSKNIAIEFVQNFGTGGSPSAAINAIGSKLVKLSTDWKRYSVNVTLPSISGKTIGTNGDDFMHLNIWYDALNEPRSSYLSQQSGVFDIACVQLEEGSVATPFEELPIEVSQMRVNRYFQHYDGSVSVSRFPVQFLVSSNIYKFQIPLMGLMRTTPSVSHNLTNANFSSNVNKATQAWGLLTDTVAWSTKSSGTFVITVTPTARLIDVLVTGGVLENMNTPIAACIGGLCYFNFDARL